MISYRSLMIIEPVRNVSVVRVVTVVIITTVGPVCWIQRFHTQRAQEKFLGHL